MAGGAKIFTHCLTCKRGFVQGGSPEKETVPAVSTYPVCGFCFSRGLNDPDFYAWLKKKLDVAGINYNKANPFIQRKS